MKSVVSRSAAVGLESGRRARQELTKEVNVGDQAVSLRKRGGGWLGIMKRARMGCSSPSGGFPSPISIAVMPRDQMSAEKL